MSRWVRRAPLVLAGVAAVAWTAACGDNSSTGSTQPKGSGSPLTSTSAGPSTTGAPTTPATGAGLNVTDDQAKQLCDLLRPQLSDWRVQTPTMDKFSLNATVIQWAAQNNLFLPNERGVADRVTTKACPDVRDQILSAVEIPNLSAGLVAG
ncbi:hypothetical protein [Nocardia seriolae]|uniref:hypothetical protein n=1 Tax=Nocardia seriolae TaxID=37332 RepID=UPI000EF1B3AC|nr:hypothetical protein [Nocardia seriolae]RLP30881.1 hypothetical protein D6158_16090 [Nocardia seriolae]WKY50652.1 hypothetical protein Q5P07_27125 [Nocardia seriolae]